MSVDDLSNQSSINISNVDQHAAVETKPPPQTPIDYYQLYLNICEFLTLDSGRNVEAGKAANEVLDAGDRKQAENDQILVQDSAARGNSGGNDHDDSERAGDRTYHGNGNYDSGSGVENEWSEEASKIAHQLDGNQILVQDSAARGNSGGNDHDDSERAGDRTYHGNGNYDSGSGVENEWSEEASKIAHQLDGNQILVQDSDAGSNGNYDGESGMESLISVDRATSNEVLDARGRKPSQPVETGRSTEDGVTGGINQRDNRDNFDAKFHDGNSNGSKNLLIEDGNSHGSGMVFEKKHLLIKNTADVRTSEWDEKDALDAKTHEEAGELAHQSPVETNESNKSDQNPVQDGAKFSNSGTFSKVPTQIGDRGNGNGSEMVKSRFGSRRMSYPCLEIREGDGGVTVTGNVAVQSSRIPSRDCQKQLEQNVTTISGVEFSASRVDISATAKRRATNEWVMSNNKLTKTTLLGDCANSVAKEREEEQQQQQQTTSLISDCDGVEKKSGTKYDCSTDMVSDSHRRLPTILRRPYSHLKPPTRPAKRSHRYIGREARAYDVITGSNQIEVTKEAIERLSQIPNLIGPFICRLCERDCHDAFGLAAHSCPCIGQQQYSCDCCDKVFNCPANLASHQRSHRPTFCMAPKP